MSIFTGSAIWLTNRLRKWTEIRVPQKCVTSTTTCRVWYHILVLFIIVARVFRYVVMDRHTRKPKMAPKTGNSKTFRQEQHFCEIPTDVPIFSGAPNPKDVSPSRLIMINVKSQTSRPKSCNNLVLPND